MATKGKSSDKAAKDTKVTRIKATDTSAKSTKTNIPKPTTKKAEAVVASKTPTKTKRANPAKAAGGYFKGAWYELKQVRWPNRRATWGMTLALIGFTAFFVAFILLLDAAFKYTFQLTLGS